MKTTLLLAFLLCSGLSRAQPIIQSATKQDWVGGTCCHGGGKYHVVISGSKDVIQHIKITSIVQDGRLYENPVMTKTINEGDTLSYLNIEFSYYYSKSMEDRIVSPPIEPKKPLEEGIFYTLHRVDAKLMITEIKELAMIAYP